MAKAAEKKAVKRLVAIETLKSSAERIAETKRRAAK